MVVLASPAHAGIFFVNSTADTTDSGGCTSDSGGCTLREAMIAANNSSGDPTQDVITFDRVLGGLTITLGSTLPNITDTGGLIINGGGANPTICGANAFRVISMPQTRDVGLTLRELTVANASFTDGGGVFNNGTGQLIVSDSTFSRNAANGGGGAVYNNGTMSVINSTFSGNTAGSGGGKFNPQGTLTVSNSTISGNGATSTLFGGGNIGAFGGTTTLKNTIVANSSAGSNCEGSVTDGGYNLDSGTSCGFSTNNHSLSSTDPLLDPDGLQDNGGPTNTIALQRTSPAIDKGNAFGLTTTDQRGELRPQDLADDQFPDASGGDGSDIGAFELQPELSINDVSVTEGNSGTTGATFTVSLSEKSAHTVTVDYLTSDGTATAGVDYQGINASKLTFAPGETSKTFNVTVNGDDVFESDETFIVHLISSTNAPISDAQGIGTITNDDPPPNTAPTAEPDSYSTNEDTVLSANVLANDSDPDSGDTLTAVLVNGPTNGKLDLNADGTFTYTPNADFNGTDSFTYKASDGSADSNVATVTITVTPVNDAPKIEVVGGTQSTCLTNTSARTTLKLTDVETSTTDLTLNHTSSNISLLPNNNVTFAVSTDTTRTATFTTLSGRTGISTVRITVSDGQASTTSTVRVRAGGNGRDTLSCTSEADILLGQNGDDTLRGLAKSDVLCGANGNDRLTGGDGADHFGGGSGTDTATDFTAGVDTRSAIP